MCDPPTIPLGSYPTFTCFLTKANDLGSHGEAFPEVVGTPRRPVGHDQDVSKRRLVAQAPCHVDCVSSQTSLSMLLIQNVNAAAKRAITFAVARIIALAEQRQRPLEQSHQDLVHDASLEDRVGSGKTERGASELRRCPDLLGDPSRLEACLPGLLVGARRPPCLTELQEEPAFESLIGFALEPERLDGPFVLLHGALVSELPGRVIPGSRAVRDCLVHFSSERRDEEVVGQLGQMSFGMITIEPIQGLGDRAVKLETPLVADPFVQRLANQIVREAESSEIRSAFDDHADRARLAQPLQDARRVSLHDLLKGSDVEIATYDRCYRQQLAAFLRDQR